MLLPGFYCVKCERPTAQVVVCDCCAGHVVSCTASDCQHDEHHEWTNLREPRERRRE